MDFKPQLPQLEIPEPVRQMAERNVEHSRAAYMQFVELARQTQEMLATSSGAMARSALELQGKAIRFTEQSVEAGLSLASELARARDMKEYMEIQGKHAQRQMETFASQAQEFGRLMTDAAEKAQKKP